MARSLLSAAWLVVWLLYAASTGLANDIRSDSIESSPETGNQLYRDGVENYDTAQMDYGQLFARMLGAYVRSEEPEDDGSDENDDNDDNDGNDDDGDNVYERSLYETYGRLMARMLQPHARSVDDEGDDYGTAEAVYSHLMGRMLGAHLHNEIMARAGRRPPSPKPAPKPSDKPSPPPSPKPSPPATKSPAAPTSAKTSSAAPTSAKTSSSSSTAPTTTSGPDLDNDAVPEKKVAEKKGRDLLKELTTAKMKQYRRYKASELKNKCVFYTQAVNKPPEYLSEDATKFACSHNKLSVWHLWPNKAMEKAEPKKYKDFYGADEKGTWLNTFYNLPKIASDKDVPTHIQYFENMSEAMAEDCSGEVVIMTQTPDDMSRYTKKGAPENIWKNKERPALQKLKKSGKVTKFYVVDWNNQNDMWEFDIETEKLGKKVKTDVLVSREVYGDGEDGAGDELQERAARSCPSNGLAQRLKKGDPFSEDYKKL